MAQAKRRRQAKKRAYKQVILHLSPEAAHLLHAVARSEKRRPYAVVEAALTLYAKTHLSEFPANPSMQPALPASPASTAPSTFHVLPAPSHPVPPALPQTSGAQEGPDEGSEAADDRAAQRRWAIMR